MSIGLCLIFDQSNPESLKDNQFWLIAYCLQWYITRQCKFWLYSLQRNLLVALLEKMLDSHEVQQEAWGMVEPCLSRINKHKSSTSKRWQLIKSVLVLDCSWLLLNTISMMYWVVVNRMSSFLNWKKKH